jgi:hypothetical protein
MLFNPNDLCIVQRDVKVLADSEVVRTGKTMAYLKILYYPTILVMSLCETKHTQVQIAEIKLRFEPGTSPLLMRQNACIWI